ncbi:phage portal protein [Elizabethkingia meningoseptica]|uniref:phage portal protein n=1 Tax=Elizabethkingia meningoseptica TaxID=238 RepID=UPI0023AEA8B9|nr:phage portal protein [Elizabethkingia meningoseptica]MDE5516410.1 phage portal protein [Elizabethkingia meningoseptica]MDN4033732.1 phage portal protein [Elizabethkingia meningoseptica]
MARIFGSWFKRDKGSDTAKDYTNAFNKAFYQFIGGLSAKYDYDNKTYLEKGYGHNPDVYAVITQQAEKIRSVPYVIKKVKDKQAKRRYDLFEYSMKGELQLNHFRKRLDLQTKAYEDREMPFPLEDPNPNQTWGEVFALYEVFMQTTGNFFLYTVSPENGAKAGEPIQAFVLPSQLVKIVLKKGADLLSIENPIDYYMLIEGDQYIQFREEEVVHVKLPNPFFDMNGSHFYGLSPIKVLLRNIEASNDALDQNVKTMKNGGVFGFISGKDSVWTAEQAIQMKEKLKEMDKDPGRLSRIAGSSAPVEFTKLSLNTDELKPFDYLRYNQKQICNVLGWSDKLLNNDEGAKYSNVKEARKTVITDHIVPRLILLQEALNKKFIPRFKGYENCVIEWDYTELPEMQEDIKYLVEWYSKAPVTPNEFRTALRLETLDEEGMNTVWIEGSKKRIDEVGLTQDELNKAFGYGDQ